MLDGLVRFVAGRFEFAGWLVLGIGLVMEAAVGEGSTAALVEEQEQERDLHAFVREPVGIAAAIALEESVTFQFAQIVAELIETVSAGRKLKRGTAWWICLAVEPPTVWAPCRRSSIRRMVRVSWILIPGYRTEPMVMGSASRCSRGKSTWTLRHCA